MAEWFKAPVLKTGRLTPRKFESCPFRHENCLLQQAFFDWRFGPSVRILSLPPCSFRTHKKQDSFFESNLVPSASKICLLQQAFFDWRSLMLML